MNIAHQQARLQQTLAERGITDSRVLDAIGRTRRDLFVPEESRTLAYEDQALCIAEGQTISQPFIVALMTQSLELRGDELVLEIGTGSGYQTAVLAQLCREIVTIERLETLSRDARRLLEDLGCTNIDFRIGDGTLGCPERGPYDGILVTAAAPDVPAPLFNQLCPGGRLIVPVGDEQGQRLLSIEKQSPPVTRELCACRFVRLIGDAAWEA